MDNQVLNTPAATGEPLEDGVRELTDAEVAMVSGGHHGLGELVRTIGRDIKTSVDGASPAAGWMQRHTGTGAFVIAGAALAGAGFGYVRGAKNALHGWSRI